MSEARKSQKPRKAFKNCIQSEAVATETQK
jgi:hypothetical protein